MKLSFFKRIFLSFTVVTILLTNFALLFLYYLTEKNYILSVKQNILQQADTIKTFLTINNNQFNLLPLQKLQKNNLGFIVNIQKTNYPIKTQFIKTQKLLIFQTYFHGYTIVIGKELNELNYIKQNFVKSAILISIVSIFFILIISFYLSKWLLKPIDKILDFLQKYKLGQEIYLENYYKGTDIGFLVDKINNFVKKLNQAYYSQKQFIQDISHEIKTPLMQISSTIELIEEDCKPYKPQLEMIKSKIEQISTLVRQILFMEKLNENLKKEKINLAGYIKNLLRDYENIAKQKGIQINLKINSSPEITANRYYLDRLFGNLLANAIKYNKKNGQINISINKNKISIEDTGVGIAKQDLEKIFNRFYKGENSDGSGLGLSIVKKIVELLGWDIKVYSKVGSGTKFEIIFSS